MGNGLYSAVSGSNARLKQLEVLSNNLAHTNTTGFKADTVRFEEVLTGKDSQSRFVEARESRTRHTQGPLRKTDNPLDVAIIGKGFLVVDTPRGDRLTRAGRFVIGADNILRTVSGHAVRGVTGQTITIPTLREREGKGPIVIDEVGQLSSGGHVLGQLLRVSTDGAQVKKEGHDLFRCDKSVDELPAALDTTVIQGQLEQSNVNPVRLMTEIIEVQRHFEALQQVVKTYRSIDGQATRRIV
jgi:flagellar basal-body rod protein FlgF